MIRAYRELEMAKQDEREGGCRCHDRHCHGPIEAALARNDDFIAGAHMKAIERHPLRQCDTRVGRCPNDRTSTTDGYPSDVTVTWSTSPHDHVAQGHIRSRVVETGKSHASEH